MKFEKFLKGCGTHGRIVKRENGDTWLICGGVGMKVPAGVITLLGDGVERCGEVCNLVEAIVRADTDDRIQLTEATLPADGKASDIVRVFSDGCDRVRIRNADFGLLERSDVVLAYLEIEDDDFNVTRYLLVLDPAEEVIGFITGVPE